ncbi:hypothetical protein [Rhizobium sp. MHM7A]|uniref:hypothetical protein n=1 Tax=Rhizobium sp. MHM7A TaxID=2583233 RepID=UPI001106BCCE|nr:hypothetical protein [Rhizobium sp. MHM7A]TLX16440.1 hypothetical protein FFR93_03645 [Rhizobium sp. MHM7A]
MTDFGMRRISLFGEDLARMVPGDALLFLTAHWPAISGPYSSSSSEDVEIDLANLLAEKSAPVIMRRSGVFVGFDAIRPRIDLGSHSVVVLECLLRLGDLLHDVVDNENLKVSWQKAKARTQLFPMAEERLGIDDDLVPTTPVLPSDNDLADATMSIASREFWEETKWLAKQLSQSFVEYCSIAYWLTARNLLAATDKTEVAPTGEEWAWETMERPPELPPFEVITDMLHRAAKAIGTDVNSVARDALFDRNSWARQIVVYKRWFGGGESRSAHRAGLVTGSFHIELTQFDAKTGAGKAKAGYREGETTLKAINPDVNLALQGLVGRCVTVEGTATFTAENKTPLSINVSKAELDKHAEGSKARLKKLLRD